MKEKITNWTYDLKVKSEDLRKNQIYELMKDKLDFFGLKDLNSFGYNNWDIRDFAVLAYNQSLVEAETGRKNSELGEFLSKLAAPFICHTKAMISEAMVEYYERMRESGIEKGFFDKVIESEELICKTSGISSIGEDLFWKEDGKLKKNLINELVDRVDFEIMSDMVQNARVIGTVAYKTLSKSDIMWKISEVTQMVKSKFAEPIDIWAVGNNNVIRELVSDQDIKNSVDVSKNLKLIPCSEGFKLYQTDLISNNVLLLGTNTVKGYCFAPYVPFAPLTSYGFKDTVINTCFGKKLFRDGGRNYATIEFLE